jgi:beta-lactamase superfamily II metal-dependent hydrolase
LDGSNLTSPPEDLAEISIFGTGLGESIVIHFGYGDWAVIDSCINPINNKSAALDYFEKIGIDITQAVKLILASHWHDDHIRGIAETFKKCRKAVFCCSDILKEEQFIVLGKSSKRFHSHSTGGIDEFSEIIDELASRRKLYERSATVGPEWASANMRLLKLDGDYRQFEGEMYSLSPSSTEKSIFLRQLSELTITEKKTKSRILDIEPNYISVVAWAVIGNINILLGADLENFRAPGRGWNAILNSRTKPDGKARIIKIPHHGSKNAHNELVWKEMIEKNPLAMLSTYSRGTNPLPSPDDITRLCGLTPYVYSTNLPGQFKPKRRSSTVERLMKELARTRVVRGGRFGQVRVRFNPLSFDDYEVALIKDARELCKKKAC